MNLTARSLLAASGVSLLGLGVGEIAVVAFGRNVRRRRLDGQLMPTEANEIMAAALEADASLQEAGTPNQIGHACEGTFPKILEADKHYDESVAFALAFWDCWANAAKRNWRTEERVAEANWPRYAREVAADLRRGAVPDDPVMLEQLIPRRRKRYPHWFRGVFGRAV